MASSLAAIGPCGVAAAFARAALDFRWVSGRFSHVAPYYGAMRLASFAVSSSLVLLAACSKEKKSEEDWSYAVSIKGQLRGAKIYATEGAVFPSEGKMAFRFWKSETAGSNGKAASCNDLPSVLETINFDIPVSADGTPVLGTYGAAIYGGGHADAENVSISITAADLDDRKKGVKGTLKVDDEGSHTTLDGPFTVRPCPASDKKDEIKPVAAFAKAKKGDFGGTIKGKEWKAKHGLVFVSLDRPAIRSILLSEKRLTCDGPADKENVEVHLSDFGWGDAKSGHHGPQPAKVEIVNLEYTPPRGSAWITFDDEAAKPGTKITGSIVTTSVKKGLFELDGHFEATVCKSGKS